MFALNVLMVKPEGRRKDYRKKLQKGKKIDEAQRKKVESEGKIINTQCSILNYEM